MTSYKPGEKITADFLLQCMNAPPVLEMTRFCLQFTRKFNRESGFEVISAIRGPIIGISNPVVGKKRGLVFPDDIVRDLFMFWHIPEKRIAGRPRVSLMPLLTIHAVPVEPKELLMFLPSREDLSGVLRYDRNRAHKDHDIALRSLCIELRPYPDQTRFFVVQEVKPHSNATINVTISAASRAKTQRKHRAAIVASMLEHHFNLRYGVFGRSGFGITSKALEPYEFLIELYKGK